jgi:DNA-binding XRE family transcriptional regulator
VIWCEDCNVCICPLCIFDGNHKNHQVAPVNVMKEFQHVRKRLKKTKMVLAGRVDDLHKSLQSIEKNKDGLNTKCVQMRKKIDKECESMIALIKKQHQDMYLQMESAMTKKQKRKEKQIATIANDIDRTNSILSEIQAILDTEQPAAFLEKVKTSKAVESECPSLKHQPSLLSTNRIAATPPPRPPKLPMIKNQLKAASK